MKKINSQYSNIRNQNKNEILEDYVEAIQEISEIKGDVKNADLSIHFGVSQATINKNLKRLISSKLATSAGAKVVGYACIIDRSKGESLIKEKIVSQIELNIPTYTKDNLPKSLSSIKAVKPGSRNL